MSFKVPIDTCRDVPKNAYIEEVKNDEYRP